MNSLMDIQAKYDEIEAVDYFCAKHVYELLLPKLMSLPLKGNDIHSIEESGVDVNTSAPFTDVTELVFNLLLAVNWFLRQGHSCVPLKVIANQQYWSSKIELNALPYMSAARHVEQDKPGYTFPDYVTILKTVQHYFVGVNDFVVFDCDALYWRRYQQFEFETAMYIKQRLSNGDTVLTGDNIERLKMSMQQLFPASSSINEVTLPATEQNASTVEVDWQKVAVANSIHRQLSIICGGPGTGKTYTVSRLLYLLLVLNPTFEITMAAPTGKAAQRLKESIGQAKKQLLGLGLDVDVIKSIPEHATTLHRLLGFRPNTVDLKFNREQQLTCDVLLIDEVSMIDLPMMTRLLRALPDHARLILLGDSDQLPSVEVGNVLSDLVEGDNLHYDLISAQLIEQLSSQQVATLSAHDTERVCNSHVTYLLKTHRFGGDIGSIAREIITQKANESWLRLCNSAQFKAAKHDNLTSGQPAVKEFNTAALNYISPCAYESWLEHICTEYYAPVLSASTINEAFQRLARFRVLLPTRVGERGVMNVNAVIEGLLSQHYRVKPLQHYQGRPIMVTENSYSTGLFNGDVGIIWPDESGRLTAFFESDGENPINPFKSISLARLPHVETVFAMTIHKTQGSEFGHVGLVLPIDDNAMLTPELIYTGVTRAKQSLSVMSSEYIWKAAINRNEKRYTGLKIYLNGEG